MADLLMSQRRWGRTRCQKLLAQIPMSEKKTVGSMTDRQRRSLAAMLSSAEEGHGSTGAGPAPACSISLSQQAAGLGGTAVH